MLDITENLYKYLAEVVQGLGILIFLLFCAWVTVECQEQVKRDRQEGKSSDE